MLAAAVVALSLVALTAQRELRTRPAGSGRPSAAEPILTLLRERYERGKLDADGVVAMIRALRTVELRHGRAGRAAPSPVPPAR